MADQEMLPTTNLRKMEKTREASQFPERESK
jgi:hypothetical protein